MELKPRQQQAYDAVFTALNQGITRQLIALPTGVGKTVLGAHIAKNFQKTLFLAHRMELISQTATTMSRVAPEIPQGFIMQGRHDPAPFTVGMIQTTYNRLNRISPDAATAKQAVTEWQEVFNGRFSYIDTYRETYHSSTATRLTLATYRTAKQAGGKSRQAIVYGNLDPYAVLTRLHGEAIQIKGMRPLEPAAAPLSAPEPEPVKILPEPVKPPEPLLELESPELRVENVAAPLEPAALEQEDQVEIRALVWRVYLEGGRTAVLRDPDRPTLPDALALANRMMSGVSRVEAA